MKRVIYVFILLTLIMTSCENNEEVLQQMDKPKELSIQKENEKMQNLLGILLQASNNSGTINEVYSSVKKSLEYGLDETMYIDDVMNNNSSSSKIKMAINKCETISSHANSKAIKINSAEIFSVSGLEVYWPYAEDWDKISTPVLAYWPSDKEYVDGEKITAYKYTKLNNGQYKKDSLLVDETYSKTNPVWIIKSSSLSEDDLEKIFNGEPTKNGVRYCPRNKKLLKKDGRQLVTNAVQTTVAETKVNTLKSVKQHDTWINGGSEYIIYWFFPTADFGLSQHSTEQICLSRKEIGNGTVRTVNFNANYDWFVGQLHNKFKIIEFDPGSDIKWDVKLSTTYTSKDKTINASGEFRTTIGINNNDEHINEETVPRTAMLTTETRVSDGYFEKSFTKSGVTIVVSIRGIEGVSL